MDRRSFGKLAVATGVSSGLAGIAGMVPDIARAAQAQFVFKIGNDVPSSHPISVRLNEIAPKILAESKGRLELRVFPDNQLGGDTDVLSQLRAGALEMFVVSGNILSTMSKVTAMSGIAFAFPDYAHVWSAMDGDMGNYLRAGIAKLGLHPLDKLWDNGFRQVTSSTHPIAKPEDLKGFKIRVPVSPLWTSTFSSLGAAPTGINFSEVYSALQTHIVDGQENAIPLIDASKFYEVQKYVSKTNHMWDGFYTLVNARAWTRLPPDLQEILVRNINEATDKERADIAALNQSLEGNLRKHGMTINSTDIGQFRSALSKVGYYKKWKEIYGPEAWALLEKHAGKLV
jgi:tripartite ATP-independent transporter DctP family solute receptor